MEFNFACFRLLHIFHFILKLKREEEVFLFFFGGGGGWVEGSENGGSGVWVLHRLFRHALFFSGFLLAFQSDRKKHYFCLNC